jgi:hypothetical protein
MPGLSSIPYALYHSIQPALGAAAFICEPPKLNPPFGFFFELRSLKVPLAFAGVFFFGVLM